MSYLFNFRLNLPSCLLILWDNVHFCPVKSNTKITLINGFSWLTICVQSKSIQNEYFDNDIPAAIVSFEEAFNNSLMIWWRLWFCKMYKKNMKQLFSFFFIVSNKCDICFFRRLVSVALSWSRMFIALSSNKMSQIYRGSNSSSRNCLCSSRHDTSNFSRRVRKLGRPKSNSQWFKGFKKKTTVITTLL